MSRNFNRQDSYLIAAEKMRLKKEKEAREEKEFYENITSGKQWLLFKSIVIFCTLILALSIYDVFVDGKTKKLSENSWKIDKTWEYTWHKVLDVEGYMFTPTLANWSNRVENSLEMTYSPIFCVGKKLKFDIQVDESILVKHSEIRQRSIFTWFPAFQIFLLIPLLTYLFKQQSTWFNFARLLSMAFVFPGTLMAIYAAIF